MTGALAIAGRTVRGCIASFKLDLIIAAQYRVSIAVWVLVSILEGVIYMAVWQAVAVASGGSAGGLDERDFAGYFLLMVLLRDVVTSGLMYQLPGRVRTGSLATLLLRPFHPVAYLYGFDMGFTMRGLLFKVPLVAILVFVFDARIAPSAAAVVVALLLVIPLAMSARMFTEAIVATSAMWLVRIDGIRGGYTLIALLLGGQFAPIAVLPDWLASIARALPFYWSLGYPVELLQGRAPVGDAWIAVAVLAGWTVAFCALLQPVWRAGTRAYESVGQ